MGFVATRLAGTDGGILENGETGRDERPYGGHAVFYCAGELEGDVPGLLAPELHFTDPAAVALGQRAFGTTEPDPTLVADIKERAQVLTRPTPPLPTICYRICHRPKHLRWVIPMQLPSVSITLLAATELLSLAHNHDLYWERDRFQTNWHP